MVEKNKKNTESELAALLDSALADFGHTRNTDDELDSMMDAMDQEAARKAAQKFDESVKIIQEDASNRQISATNSSGTLPMTENERQAAENFQNMLRALVEAEQEALKERSGDKNDDEGYDRTDEETFIGKLKKLSEQDPTNITDESQYETMMSLVQTFFAKDLMYPPLKQLLEKFPKYIEEHSELDASVKNLYEKQIDVLQRVCAEYEKDEGENLEVLRLRFDTISTLMMELQSYGYPPDELVGETPPGWVTDPQTGLPKVGDVSKAAEACSLM